MNTRDYKPKMLAVLKAFGRTGEDRRILAMALLNDATQVRRWEKATERDEPFYPNQETRDAIDSLLDPSGDPLTQGMAWSARTMQGTAEDMARVVELRRKLRDELRSTPQPHEDDLDESAEAGISASDEKAEARKRDRRKKQRASGQDGRE